MNAVILILLCTFIWSEVSPASVNNQQIINDQAGSLKDGIDCNVPMDWAMGVLNGIIVEDGYDPDKIVDINMLDIIKVSGDITGFSTAARSSDCIMYTGASTNYSYEFSLTNLKASLTLKISNLLYTQTAQSTAKFADVITKVQVVSDSIFGPYDITKFKIKSISTCDVTVTGLGIFDYMYEDIEEAVCEMLESFITDFLQGTMENIFDEIINGEENTSTVSTQFKHKIGKPRV